MAINMHIGGAFRLLQRPEKATMDQLIVLSPSCPRSPQPTSW